MTTRKMQSKVMISIHTSREGCDSHKSTSQRMARIFQSTHPVRDVTIKMRGIKNDDCISIHTSREGCDNMDISTSTLYE